MNRVKINVSGTHFEFDRKIVNEKKSHRLAYLCANEPDYKPLELTVDRSAIAFGAILSYYQTGELHIPPGICPGAFRREMEFWELDADVLHECCLYRYQAFLDDEDTRRRFLHKTLQPTSTMSPAVSPAVVGKLTMYRSRLWDIMDNNVNSIAAKLYFILVFMMVLLSVFVLAFSTEPSMRRGVSKCELLEYMENTGNDNVDKVKETLGNPDCSTTGSWPGGGSWYDEEVDFDFYDWDYYEFSWGYFWEALEDIPHGFWESPVLNTTTAEPHSQSNSTSTTGASSTQSTVTPSVYDYASMLQNFSKEKPVRRTIYVPDLTVPKYPFFILEIIISIFFTVDFILRLVSCPSLRRYFLSIINVLDAFALFSCYVHIIIVSVEKEYRYKDSVWLNLLDFAQVFRALRLFRVVKNVRASKVLAYSLKQDVRDMTLLVMLLFVGISTFACLFYFAESRETIPSIPNAWYWAIVTMTTVGYGDISPQTGIGRVIASICAICGVLLLAITLPMFVNNFLTLYQYSCVNESIEKRKGQKKVDDVIGSKANDLIVTDVDKPPAYETPKKTVDAPEVVSRGVTMYHVKEAAMK
ncbi:potassium voltage-gated channel protein Shaw-like [Mercenaria mercenaria]|uniref:potassium voltage-gated channel protein Shaw-like n=1 Tax=Mercenaria mercenaria TaxID=6596 RepID=UPI00234F3118|nr:potassium voltage-gated channel protein Shaw-like [Mercenaria mercenaria]